MFGVSSAPKRWPKPTAALPTRCSNRLSLLIDILTRGLGIASECGFTIAELIVTRSCRSNSDGLHLTATAIQMSFTAAATATHLPTIRPELTAMGRRHRVRGHLRVV